MQRGQSLMMIPIIHVLLISVGGIQMEIPILSPYVTKKKSFLHCVQKGQAVIKNWNFL